SAPARRLPPATLAARIAPAPKDRRNQIEPLRLAIQRGPWPAACWATPAEGAHVPDCPAAKRDVPELAPDVAAPAGESRIWNRGLQNTRRTEIARRRSSVDSLRHAITIQH